MASTNNPGPKINPALEAAKQQLESAQRERDDAVASRRSAEEKIEKLEKENGQLRSLCQKLREDAPPEVGDGAYLLTESVTFSSFDGKMTSGTVGDVVVISTDSKPANVDAIKKKIGAGYRVYAVAKDTLDELAQKGMLRG